MDDDETARSAPPPLAPAPLALPLRRNEVVLLASPLPEVSPATNLEAIASALASQRELEKPAQPARRLNLRAAISDT